MIIWSMISLKSLTLGIKTPIGFIFIYMAAPAAYGSSWARSQIEAAAFGLCHSHGNTGSELHLLPMPQVAAMLDP